MMSQDDTIKKSKQRDRSVSEEKILNAAKEVFSKYGFQGATTRAISKKANMNESLIARYFGGKYGLLLRLVENMIEEGYSLEIPYPAQDNLIDELNGFVEFKLEQFKLKSGFFKIIVSQALTDPKFLKKALEKIPLHFEHPQLTSRLKTLKENGKIRSDVKIEQIFIDVDTQCMGIFFFQFIIRGESTEKLLEQLKIFVKNYSLGIINKL
ncbi:MAG: helix-turn-helix transcriptional regulator [Bdellovibrionales bacterium]|nr:helix-turn-helix transcriptional regulator [Bdellovibrionales bacterium]